MQVDLGIMIGILVSFQKDGRHKRIELSHQKANFNRTEYMELECKYLTENQNNLQKNLYSLNSEMEKLDTLLIMTMILMLLTLCVMEETERIKNN